MFDWQILRNAHKGMMGALALLMGMSLLVIASKASYTYLGITDDLLPQEIEISRAFWIPLVKSQLGWCALGWIVFLGATAMDYRRLREWAWPLYLLALLSLIGLFFAPAIQHVHRWYRIKALRTSIQPAEYAKLTTIFALAWWCERFSSSIDRLSTTLIALLIAFVPFVLILKEPDLGTALILWPTCLGLLIFAGGHEKCMKLCTWLAGGAVCGCAVLFLGFISYDAIEPVMSRFLKEYQLARLRPAMHHQKAAMAALALGGIAGRGWHCGKFSTLGWLPEPTTDAVFPSLGEEFGLIGMFIILAAFYRLFAFGLEVAIMAKENFGRCLAIGIALNCAAHVIVNVAMMAGIFPVTGVPLPLISYGGSAILANMMGWGILQSIYCRRFMFR